MTDDREPFREARAAGLKARHEQRLENARYTAAEVKVLTAKARIDTAQEIATMIETFLEDPHSEEEDCADCSLMRHLARVALKIGATEASA